MKKRLSPTSNVINLSDLTTEKGENAFKLCILAFFYDEMMNSFLRLIFPVILNVKRIVYISKGGFKNDGPTDGISGIY